MKKFAIIDLQSQTHNYLQTTQSSLGKFTHINCKGTGTDDLSIIANKISEGSYDVVLINIESKFAKANRSDLKGIELLFWLRLKENFLGTIITYGFLSPAQILRLKPEYVVIHAPGNFHLRLPDEIGGISKYLEHKSISKIDEYKAFLKPFINIQAIRHSSANYYALKKLKKLHHQISNTEIRIDISDNYSTTELVYDSFFETNSKSQLEKEAERNLNGKIEKTEDEIDELKELLTPKKGNKGLLEGRAIDKYLDYKKTVEGMNPNNDFYDERVNDMGRYKNIVKKYEAEKKQKIILLNNLKNSLENDTKEEIAKTRIEQLKEQLAELEILKGKIVLVDDLAEKGWLSFYSELVGRYIEIINQELPKEKKDFDALGIAKSILNKIPNLVLLDMRLFEGEEKATYPSGIRVLKELRKLNPIVPIIVCSASNRGSVINLIHQEGANYYWLKEGIDLEIEFEESLNNYVRLIHLFKTTLSENQVTLQEIYNRFQMEIVNSECSLWWEKKDWGYSLTLTNHLKSVYYELIPQITEINEKSNLFGILQKGFVSYSSLLLKKESQNELPNWENCASSISLTSHILEYVHRIDIIRDNFNKIKEQKEVLLTNSTQSASKIISGHTINSRKGQELFKAGRFDKKGAELLELRNKASHFEGAFGLKNEDVLNFYKAILDYLIQPNNTYYAKQHFERTNFHFENKECTIKATI